MKNEKRLNILCWVCAVFILMVALTGMHPAHAFTPGKVIDRTNVDEAKDVLIQPLYNWVKKGDFVLQTAELEFPWKLGDKYAEMTAQNAGKYDINEKGALIDKKTGKLPGYVQGNPFPTIDPKHPRAGAHIMENMQYHRFGEIGTQSNSEITWIGRGGKERSVIATGQSLIYQNRWKGPIPNPNNYEKQSLTYVPFPFELRGTVSMSWDYLDEKESVAFAYAASIRRARRTSAASRSNPFLGSDMCSDDGGSWGGRNSSMEWKLVGEQTILVPVTSTNKEIIPQNPDGKSFDRKYFNFKPGYSDPTWKGAPWAVLNLKWVRRPVWIVEAMPKDPYYNYGKQILFVDKDNFVAYYKIIYDRAGLYWKTITTVYRYLNAPSIQWVMTQPEMYMAIDDRTNHATHAMLVQYGNAPWYFQPPLDVLGPNHFTPAYMIELSK